MVQRLNQIVPFEYGTHLVMTILMVFTMNFLEFILNLPLACYNIWLYVLEFEVYNGIERRKKANKFALHFDVIFLTFNDQFLTILSCSSCSVINGKHKLDETRILQDDNLSVLRKRELIKLIFFLLSFFLYLYKYVPSESVPFPCLIA
jgi:hypothetical protein